MIENSFKRLFYKATNGIEPFALLRKRNVSFGFERRRNGADELSALAGSEGYGGAFDEMKVSEAMARADGLRLNAVPEAQKAAWVYELDGQLAEMMGGKPRENRWPEVDAELRMPRPHEEIYPLYLICKIDYYNQEMGLYANDMAVYNAAMAEAQAWWRRNHRPERQGNWRVL